MKNNQKPDITEILEINQSRMFSKRLKRYLVLALVVIMAVVTAVIWMVGKSTVTQYKTEQVQSGDLTVIVTATGTLEPTNTVSVGSELSGIIKTVEVNYNDNVKVGQVLARLDTSKLEAELNQYRAALESAKAKVLQAQATAAETRAKLAQLQNVRELSNGKVPSQTEMDAAEAAFERAKADLASTTADVSQSEATIQALETDIYKSAIRSPINGTVLTRDIEPGQTVAASFQAPVLFTLAEDLSQMELHLNVDEADVGKVQEGQNAAFNVDAYPNRTFEAVVTQVRYASTTTSGVVTYETVLKVNNPDLSLRPGMTATAEITIKKVENVIQIPTAALRFTPPADENTDDSSDGDLISKLLPRPPKSEPSQRDEVSANKRRQQVWILKNGQLSPVSITTGATNGGMTEVVGVDIQPGMEVVVDIISGDE